MKPKIKMHKKTFSKIQNICKNCWKDFAWKPEHWREYKITSNVHTNIQGLFKDLPFFGVIFVFQCMGTCAEHLKKPAFFVFLCGFLLFVGKLWESVWVSVSTCDNHVIRTCAWNTITIKRSYRNKKKGLKSFFFRIQWLGCFIDHQDFWFVGKNFYILN